MKIHKLDKQILALLNERAKLILKVGQLKNKNKAIARLAADQLKINNFSIISLIYLKKFK